MYVKKKVWEGWVRWGGGREVVMNLRKLKFFEKDRELKLKFKVNKFKTDGHQSKQHTKRGV